MKFCIDAQRNSVHEDQCHGSELKVEPERFLPRRVVGTKWLVRLVCCCSCCYCSTLVFFSVCFFVLLFLLMFSLFFMLLYVVILCLFSLLHAVRGCPLPFLYVYTWSRGLFLECRKHRTGRQAESDWQTGFCVYCTRICE